MLARASVNICDDKITHMHTSEEWGKKTPFEQSSLLIVFSCCVSVSIVGGGEVMDDFSFGGMCESRGQRESLTLKVPFHSTIFCISI